MSATAAPARRRVLVRGDLVHDITLLPATGGEHRLVLPQPLPTVVLRTGTAERVDLLTGASTTIGHQLCGPTTRPWAVAESGAVTVLRLRPEALARLGVVDPGRLVDAGEPLDLGEVGPEGVDAALSAVAGPMSGRDRLLRTQLGAAVGLILAERGWVATVEVARAAQVPPSELFRVLDEVLGTGPEELAAAQRLRCTVRDAVPAQAPAARVLAALADLAALPPRELERLGLDHGSLAGMVQRGRHLLGLG